MCLIWTHPLRQVFVAKIRTIPSVSSIQVSAKIGQPQRTHQHTFVCDRRWPSCFKPSSPYFTSSRIDLIPYTTDMLVLSSFDISSRDSTRLYSTSALVGHHTATWPGAACHRWQEALQKRSARPVYLVRNGQDVLLCSGLNSANNTLQLSVLHQLYLWPSSWYPFFF